MRLIVRVVSAFGEIAPPAGAALYVQARDTTFEDELSPTFAEARATVEATGSELATVALEIDQLPGSAVLWAHIDVDGDGRVSRGDYVTTQAYPIEWAERAELSIVVRPV